MNAPLRLWHQSMTELEHLPAYRQGLEARAREVLGDRVRVEVHGLAPGSYAGYAPSDVLGYPYASNLVLAQAVDAAREAEAQGYDGFVIGSFSEPLLRQIRSAVDLPIASMTEATLLIGCSLGARMAMVANAPSVAGLVRDAVAAHHLGDRVAAVTALGPEWTEERLAASARPEIVRAFVDVAARQVASGADVVVPAEGVLAEIVRGEGLAEVDGALVLDSLGATWLHAEMLLRLAAVGGRTSRRWHYRKAPDEMVEGLKSAVDARAAKRITREG